MREPVTNHINCASANERTYLGYLRTSVILSMIGIFIAQFYRLQHGPDPHGTFGYYALGKPLSVIFQCAALLTALLGGWRFWRQQSAMARGKVHAGGWEILSLGAAVLVVSAHSVFFCIDFGMKGSEHLHGRKADAVIKLLVMMFGVHVALEVITENRPYLL